MAYLHEIIFYEAKNSTVPMEHLVYGLLGAWYQSGQTLNDYYVYEKEGMYISYSKRVPEVCPSCKKEWNRIENPNSEEYICEECRLIGMG